jgi:hypothetical protein
LPLKVRDVRLRSTSSSDPLQYSKKPSNAAGKALVLRLKKRPNGIKKSKKGVMKKDEKEMKELEMLEMDADPRSEV